MYVCTLFKSSTDVVLDLKSIISTTLLHNYRKYAHIKSLNEANGKSALSNKLNWIPKLECECNAEYTFIECLETM